MSDYLSKEFLSQSPEQLVSLVNEGIESAETSRRLDDMYQAFLLQCKRDDALRALYSGWKDKQIELTGGQEAVFTAWWNKTLESEGENIADTAQGQLSGKDVIRRAIFTGQVEGLQRYGLDASIMSDMRLYAYSGICPRTALFFKGFFEWEQKQQDTI